jgi:uncharacterized membrane protein (UPF0127 family)
VLSCRGSKAVIELGGGALTQIDVTLGDRLELVSTLRPAPPVGGGLRSA